MASFPGSIVVFTVPNPGQPTNNPSHTAQHLAEDAEIVAIEQTLGVNCAGTYGTVALAVAAIANAEAIFTTGGNVAGTLTVTPGSMGIGTTTPGVNFDVVSSTGPLIRIYNNTSAIAGGLILQTTNIQTLITANVNSSMSKLEINADGGASYFTIGSVGNVGVGNGSPNASFQFTVVGASNAISPGIDFIDTASNNNYALYMDGSYNFKIRDVYVGADRFVVAPTSGYVGIGVTTPAGNFQVDNSGVAQLIIGNGGTSLNYIDGTNTIFRSASGTAEAMRVSSGNLGVGTTTPYASLDAAAGVRLTDTRLVTGAVITNTASTFTLTAANLVKNSIFTLSGGTASTYTLDTGSNISAAVPGAVQVGDTIPFMVSNAATVSITMASAASVGLAYAMTVTTLQSRMFYLVNTGTNTWVVY